VAEDFAKFHNFWATWRIFCIHRIRLLIFSSYKIANSTQMFIFSHQNVHYTALHAWRELISFVLLRTPAKPILVLWFCMSHSLKIIDLIQFLFINIIESLWANLGLLNSRYKAFLKHFQIKIHREEDMKYKKFIFSSHLLSNCHLITSIIYLRWYSQMKTSIKIRDYQTF
jgi:hypothetical protein